MKQKKKKKTTSKDRTHNQQKEKAPQHYFSRCLLAQAIPLRPYVLLDSASSWVGDREKTFDTYIVSIAKWSALSDFLLCLFACLRCSVSLLPALSKSTPLWRSTPSTLSSRRARRRLFDVMITLKHSCCLTHDDSYISILFLKTQPSFSASV